MLSDIFVPIIPAIVTGGLLMGINNLLTAPDLFIAGQSIVEANPGFADLAALINTFANAAFVFLPILIGFSATQRFGGNPYLGATLGMLMVHPDLLNGWGYGGALLSGEIQSGIFSDLKLKKSDIKALCCQSLVAFLYFSKNRNVFAKSHSFRTRQYSNTIIDNFYYWYLNVHSSRTDYSCYRNLLTRRSHLLI